MKNNIMYCVLASAVMFTSCKKFLMENPNKNGNDVISDVTQLDPLLNALALTKGGGQLGYATLLASDDGEIRPNLYKVFTNTAERVALGIWDKTTYTTTYSTSYDWVAGWGKIFTINTIIENADKVTGDPQLKKQVKAEALFYRAFYHSVLMVQYALHPGIDNGATPGIGYRDNTNPKDPILRRDVKYTMSRIIEDLEESEKMMIELGRTNFNLKRNWRVTVATVYSLRARMELYKAKTQADFDKAADYAQKALNVYNILVDYDTDPLMRTTEQPIANKPSKKWSRLELTIDQNSAGNFAESYFPFITAQPGAYLDGMPVSKGLYDLYDPKDLRRVKFIDNNFLYTTASALPEALVLNGLDTLDSKSYFKLKFTGSSFVLGPSTAEMYLIRAEAFARGNREQDAATELKKIRVKRFSAADNSIATTIGGTLQDVKDERRRELTFSMRWFDLKRYNQMPGEEITITKTSFDNIYDLTSPVKKYTLAPNAGFYAMPIPEVERVILGWEQNAYNGVSKQ